jgi:cytidine deaminase
VRELLSTREKLLIDVAKKAREKAYSPYSGVKIGSAVLTSRGKIFDGCNIENISYGLSNCAERTAIFKAVSEGYRDIVAIAIYGKSEEFTSPCGACRQVMLEFNENMKIIRKAENGFQNVTTAKELLPDGFKPGELKNETNGSKARPL